MKLNDRLQEIVRIDRELDAMRTTVATNVVPMKKPTPNTELHRQRAAHVAALQKGSA